MAAKKKWIVTTSGERSITAVKKDIVEAGFTVDQVHKEIGSITGTASDTAAKKIRNILGVVDLSEDVEFNIGDPDSSLTW